MDYSKNENNELNHTTSRLFKGQPGTDTHAWETGNTRRQGTALVT